MKMKFIAGDKTLTNTLFKHNHFMKKKLLAGLIFLTFSSCDNLPKEDKTKHETPNALKEEGSAPESFVKRNNEDMIESLYNELVTKTPELKALEKNIESLSGEKNDSNDLYKKFNDKNQEYFGSANSNVEKIYDSVLKQKIRLLIFNSLAKYNTKISKHEDLLKSIDLKTVTLNDLHNFLKISTTLPLIEKYQNENLPTTKPLENVSQHLDETIKRIDTLIDK
jgi:hypothetical protein